MFDAFDEAVWLALCWTTLAVAIVVFLLEGVSAVQDDDDEEPGGKVGDFNEVDGAVAVEASRSHLYMSSCQLDLS